MKEIKTYDFFIPKIRKVAKMNVHATRCSIQGSTYIYMYIQLCKIARYGLILLRSKKYTKLKPLNET